MTNGNNLREDLVKMLDVRKQELEDYLSLHTLEMDGHRIFVDDEEAGLEMRANRLVRTIDFVRAIKPPINIDLTPYIEAGSKYGQLVA